MGDSRSRREKLEAMARQTASPTEAAVAREKLRSMGVTPPPAPGGEAFFGFDFARENRPHAHDAFRCHLPGSDCPNPSAAPPYPRRSFGTSEDLWRQFFNERYGSFGSGRPTRQRPFFSIDLPNLDDEEAMLDWVLTVVAGDEAVATTAQICVVMTRLDALAREHLRKGGRCRDAINDLAAKQRRQRPREGGFW